MTRQERTAVQVGGAVVIGIVVNDALQQKWAEAMGWWAALLLSAAVAGVAAAVAAWAVGKWVKVTDA
jgi:hypothetical protein